MFSHPQTGATKAEFSVVVSFCGGGTAREKSPCGPVHSACVVTDKAGCVKSDSGRISGLRPFKRKSNSAQLLMLISIGTSESDGFKTLTTTATPKLTNEK